MVQAFGFSEDDPWNPFISEIQSRAATARSILHSCTRSKNDTKTSSRPSTRQPPTPIPLQCPSPPTATCSERRESPSEVRINDSHIPPNGRCNIPAIQIQNILTTRASCRRRASTHGSEEPYSPGIPRQLAAELDRPRIAEAHPARPGRRGDIKVKRGAGCSGRR